MGRVPFVKVWICAFIGFPKVVDITDDVDNVITALYYPFDVSEELNDFSGNAVSHR
jgi:hypothetical protein